MRDLEIGDRVQLHPATDHWMRGQRYGEVVGLPLGGTAVRVQFDNGDEATFARDLVSLVGHESILDEVVKELAGFLREDDLDLAVYSTDGIVFVTLHCDDAFIDRWPMGV